DRRVGGAVQFLLRRGRPAGRVTQPAETVLVGQDRGCRPIRRTRASRSCEKGHEMADSQSAVALTPHPFDRQTFDELGAFADEAESAFDLNTTDRGLDRLIERPNRATAGKIRARRLVRDARKYLKAHYRAEVLSDHIEAGDPHADPPTDTELA